MTKFLITGYYGFLNSGDDAILASMCEDVRSLNMASEITILSNKPEETREIYDANAVYRFSLIKVIIALIKCDVLLMGGGSLLQDRTSTRSLMYYLSILWGAKLLRKKCMIYANGIGPINKKANKKITSHILNRLDTITIRETLSFEELKKLDVHKPTIKVTADPVFSLTIKNREIDKIFEKENVKLDKPYVAVLFRSWYNKEEFVQKIADVCDNIVDNYGLDILFVPMKYPTDIAISDEIRSCMKNESSIFTQKEGVDDIIQVVGGAKFILSMRLHALLYAAIKDVPMIGFVYDPKVEYFLNELNMYTIEHIDNFNVEDVDKHIKNILDNYDELKAKINDETLELKEKALLNRVYLEKLVKEQ